MQKIHFEGPWALIGQTIIGTRTRFEDNGVRMNMFDKDWISGHTHVLKDWNDWVTDDKNSYERVARSQQYTAPSTLVKLALPYLQEGDIMDMGCGSGAVGAHLMEHGFIVDGVDLSEQMLEKAKQRNYRKTYCATAKMEELEELIPGRYHNIVSCGTYGDYIESNWITIPMNLAAGPTTLAIAGNLEALEDNLMNTLLTHSFIPVVEDIRLGHKDEKGRDVNYLYVVATRT
tara:strand:+ start:529 stop:1221 length:693 start_codon:yes stop_codon:yes gene_type:complete